MKSKLYSEEEKKFIIDNYKGRSTKELTDMFNTKFNRNLTTKQIMYFKKDHKLSSGVDAKFKKRQLPYNYLPIGSETIYYNNGIKMTYIKIGDPNIWERKQVYLYKKYIGDVPEDSVVIFLDGNKDNFDLSNLALLSKNECKMMVGHKLYGKNKEINETLIEITKLKIKTKNIKNMEVINETNNS